MNKLMRGGWEPDRETMAALDADLRYMTAALNLARRGLGRVAPNPAVGALVVKDGILLGRGWTGDGGRPHAETVALQMAGAAAKGATLYVTLEPCSHFGATPPCATAIIEAGIGCVVSALDDLDPRVAGRGHALLKAAGIELRTGVLAEAARRANLGHILRRTQNRPMVTLKLAETADGFAAGPQGAPRLMITGDLANAYVHMQRALSDAILIGGATALADDPLLSVRLPGLEARKPVRIVLDPQLALSPERRLVASAGDHASWVMSAPKVNSDAVAALRAKNIRHVRLACGADGHLDLTAVLFYCAEQGLTRIFCEGGPRLAASLLQNGFADEVIVLTAPEPLDHHDFGSNRSKIMDEIDSKGLERDFSEKPASPFSHPALGGEGLPAFARADRARLEDPSLYRLAEERMLGQDRLRRYERRL